MKFFRMRPPAAVLLVCFAVAPVSGQSPERLDRLLAEGKEAMYRLEYGEAEEIFARILDAYPDSPVGYGMMSILAWNRLLYAAANPTLHEFGMPNPYSDSKIHKPIEPESRRFHEANDRLLAVSEAILEREPQDVLALYFQGLAYENLAAEAIVVSDDRWGAVGPGRRAKSIHDEVLELDPGFVDAKVSVATYEYALATVDGFANLVLALPRLFGFFTGDKDKAFEMMAEVGRSGRYRDLDARVLLSVMHAFEGDASESVSILRELGQRYPENYMIDLNLAAVWHLRLEDPAAALATYEALLESLPEKTPGLGEGEVHFRIGKVRLGLGERDQAQAAFQRAMDSSAVESETKPLSHFYAGRIQEELGMPEAARGFYREFLSQAGSMESLEDQIETASRKLE